MEKQSNVEETSPPPRLFQRRHSISTSDPAREALTFGYGAAVFPKDHSTTSLNRFDSEHLFGQLSTLLKADPKVFRFQLQPLVYSKRSE